jgi:predicted aminopeptidase
MDNRPEEGEASYDDQMELVQTQSRFVKYYETLRKERPDDFLALLERKRERDKVWYAAAKAKDPEYKAKEAARKRLFRASKSSLKTSL